MTFDPETMTGWDSEFTSAREDIPQRTGAVEILLRVLLGLKTELTSDYYTNLAVAMSKLDWHALNFAQNAIDSGEELYSCFPSNDVLVKYTPPEKVNPDQAELAF